MQKNNELPLISIITVCYNSVKTLEQTIQSVINQTYPNIEYIIIDGGSTDDTVDIIKKYANKIAYWVSEPDDGLYYAMNKGIDVATGDYVYFLGSDDCLFSIDIINEVSQILAHDNTIDILLGAICLIDEELGLQKVFNNQFLKSDIYNGTPMYHQGMFAQRKLLQQTKFNTKYQIAADYDFFLKYYFDSVINFRYIDVTIAFYSTSGISSSKTHMKNHLKERIQIVREYKLNPKIVLAMQKEIKNRSLKKYIKQFFNAIGCLKFIINRKKLIRGWHKHSCDWSNCRWCKTLSEDS